MGTHPIFESDFDCLTDDHESDKNTRQSCLWKRRSATKSMKIFSKRASWLPKRSAREMPDVTTRMLKASVTCRSSKPASRWLHAVISSSNSPGDTFTGC